MLISEFYDSFEIGDNIYMHTLSTSSYFVQILICGLTLYQLYFVQKKLIQITVCTKFYLNMLLTCALFYNMDLAKKALIHTIANKFNDDKENRITNHKKKRSESLVEF